MNYSILKENSAEAQTELLISIYAESKVNQMLLKSLIGKGYKADNLHEVNKAIDEQSDIVRTLAIETIGNIIFERFGHIDIKKDDKK